MVPMYILSMKPVLTENSQNMSIVDPADLPLTEKKIDPSATDYLVTQCETLLENNLSKYEKCFKHEQELRFKLIETNKDHVYIRSWLENANKDCLAMKSTYGHLSRTYKILLKNNFVQNFIEHGVARERLNLKFLTVVMQVEDLRKGLNVVNGDITSLKSEYEEIQYREVLLQITSAEKSLEFVELGKSLRLKSVNVMYECERLNSFLSGACEEILKLNSEHGDLMRTYQVLLQDPIIKEFLNYAKYLESLHSKSAEKANDSECTGLSHDQAGYENVSFINLRLTEEQRLREQIEKENCALIEFSEKLCHLLYKYQSVMFPEKTVEKFTAKSTQSSPAKGNLAPSDSIMSAHEVNEKNNEVMGALENGFHLLPPGSEKNNYVPVDEKKETEAILFTEEIDLGTSSPETEVTDNSVVQHDPNGIEKRDPIMKVLSSSPNKAESSSPTIQNPLPVIKVLHKSMPHRSKKPTFPLTKVNCAVKKSRKLPGVTDFYCKICNRYYATMKSFECHKKTQHGITAQRKCPVCGRWFASKQNMSKHMLAVHNPVRPYKCSYCGWNTSNSRYLTKHLQDVHNQEKGRYCCARCGKRFMRKENMVRHICGNIVHTS